MSKTIRVQACLAAVQEDQILLVPHYDETECVVRWCLPEGTVKFGESVQVAALRGFTEATGLEARIENLLDVTEVRPSTQMCHRITVTFRGRVIGGQLRASPNRRDGNEHPRWVSPAENTCLNCHPKSTIDRALSGPPVAANIDVGDGATKKDWQTEPFDKMVALGESTTAGGWSTTPQRCWVPVLADLINDFQSTPMQVVNSGIGANVISTRSPSYQKSGKPAANERIDKHVVAHRPDLLIISYGLNDARGGTPLELFRKELADLIDRIRTRVQPLIVLPGPYYMTDFTVGGRSWVHADLTLFERFNKMICQLAHQLECLYVDLLAANGRTDWMVHCDGVHQNDLGHRIVAHRMFEVLAQNCSCLARTTKAAEKTSPRWRDESTLKADYGE